MLHEIKVPHGLGMSVVLPTQTSGYLAEASYAEVEVFAQGVIIVHQAHWFAHIAAQYGLDAG